MEIIITYFVNAIKAILKYFGFEMDAETESNLDSMFGGLKDFAPETEKGSLDM